MSGRVPFGLIAPSGPVVSDGLAGRPGASFVNGIELARHTNMFGTGGGRG